VKTVLVQKDINDRDIVSYLRQAKERQAGLVCFGELATSGCLYESRDVPSVKSLLDLLGDFEFRIMIGLPYQSSEGLRNVYLYHYRGEHQLYHKINLFPDMGEPDCYIPGTAPGIFTTDFATVGVAICYDLRFPNIFQDLKQAGAEMIVVPAAWPMVRIVDWRRLLIERAAEYQLPVLGINSVGDDGINLFGGTSIVIDGTGTVLHEADSHTPTLLEFELPL
jgi:predicted amidohydrolase